MRTINRAGSLLIAIAVVTSACASRSSSKHAEPTTAPAQLRGTLNVFAAASLTTAFTNAKTALSASHPDLNVTYNFAGSNTLVNQIKQGAPADVFASADTKNMQALIDAGLVEAPVTFAKNKLQIAVAATDDKASEVARRGAEWTIHSYINPQRMAFTKDLRPAGAHTGTGGDPIVRYLDGVIIHGSAPRVVDELQRLREEIDLHYLLCAPLSHESFMRLTEDVIPAFA